MAHLVFDDKIENVNDQSYFQFISDNLVIHVRYDRLSKFLNNQYELGYSSQDVAYIVAHNYVGYVFPLFDGIYFTLNLLQFE